MFSDNITDIDTLWQALEDVQDKLNASAGVSPS